MRFSIVATTLTGVSALMIPSPRIVKDQIETNEAALEKRVVVEALVMAAATAAVGQVAVKAVDAAIGLVKDLSDWTEARESFTQKVTAEMWSKNPSPGTYVAAICYNMDYTFANADHSEATKVELKSGSLHTDYDCMFMQKGNTFFPQGDGGFINYSYNSDGSCTHTAESLAC
ncbi:hypothetical protein INS49_006176 [Diaporthe citri]|uniref:uncharacterized protein n=1 Tax=Diaporthe citri TaxID=83186 RepID=UPI001C815811|nr:uncharacterized protein INS49_006176 [Diaporthe citri]KAG6364574.1 hypothetical protein INS49_006176 [Diaporthe citri]